MSCCGQNVLAEVTSRKRIGAGSVPTRNGCHPRQNFSDIQV
jgi:hypothetical protein